MGREPLLRRSNPNEPNTKQSRSGLKRRRRSKVEQFREGFDTNLWINLLVEGRRTPFVKAIAPRVNPHPEIADTPHPGSQAICRPRTTSTQSGPKLRRKKRSSPVEESATVSVSVDKRTWKATFFDASSSSIG